MIMSFLAANLMLLKTRSVCRRERSPELLFGVENMENVFKDGDKSAKFQRCAWKKSFVQNRFLKTTSEMLEAVRLVRI